MGGVMGLCQGWNSLAPLKKGLFQMQHLGQDFGGLAVHADEKRIIVESFKGLIKPSSQIFDGKSGSSAIGHVSIREAQPYFNYAKIGEMAAVFSGNIFNCQEIRNKFLTDNHVLTSAYNVEVLLMLIAQKNDPVAGLKFMAEEAKGGFSIVLLTPEGLFAARDPFGFSPLIIGRGLYGCAVASESAAFKKIDMEIIRDVRPGEIIFLERQGFSTVGQLPVTRTAFDTFFWAYTSRIDAVADGIPAKTVRANLGAALARHDNIEADIVAPVPMSGIGCAQGYHRASGICYEDVFLYNRYSDRSYTPSEQVERDLIAEEKLDLINEAIVGRRIILTDDSIVRGTQLRRLVMRLRSAGAKEIHVRISVPPLIAPCKYNVSTRSYEELIARRHSVDEIRKMLGADTLRYNTIEDLVASVGLSADQLCLACWTNEYPL